MKKIFSAFLLMTMMVFSVGSFVACSDLENEIAAVDKQATTNAEAIADLNSKLSTLQTALTAAQADADAAMDAAKAAAADAKKAQEAGDAAAAAAAKAQAEAEAAKAAAAQAKADAIAEATKQVEAIQEEISKINYAITNLNGASEAQAVEIEALQGEIAKLQTAAAEHVYAITNLTGQVEAHEVSIEALQVQVKAMEATLVKYGEILEALDLLTEDIKTAIAQNVYAIQTLSGRVDGIENEFGAQLNNVKAAISQNVGSIQNLMVQLEALEADIDGQLNTIRKDLEDVTANIEEQISEAVAEAVKGLAARIDALENRLQSVSYVPEWKNGPTAVLFEENEDYGYVRMAFEVAPKAYAKKITADNAKLVGVALKAAEVEQYNVKIVNADAETGIVEVFGYIPVKSDVWNHETYEKAALALRVNAADAQVTSAYQEVSVLVKSDNQKDLSIVDAVYFGTYDEDGDFNYNAQGVYNIEHKVAYDETDSKRVIFKDLVSRVYVEGFMDYTKPADAAALLGFDIKVTEKYSNYVTKYFKLTNDNKYDFVANPTTLPAGYDKNDTAPFVADNPDSLNIALSFNPVVVDSLETGAIVLSDFVNKSATVELMDGFYRVNGEKPGKFKGIKATYKVTGLADTEVLEINDNKAIEITWDKYINDYIESEGCVLVEDVIVTGGNARQLLTTNPVSSTGTKLNYVGEEATYPTITVTAVSDDEVDVKVAFDAWPSKAMTYKYTYEAPKPELTEDEVDSMTEVTVKYDITVTIGAATEQIGEVPVADTLTVNLVKSGEEVLNTTGVTTKVYLNGVVDKLVPLYQKYYKNAAKAKVAIENVINNAPVTISVVDTVTTGEPSKVIVNRAKYNYVTTATAEASYIDIPYHVETYKDIQSQFVQFSFPVTLHGLTANVIATCAKVSSWTEYAGIGSNEPNMVAGILSPKFRGDQTVKVDYVTVPKYITVNNAQVLDYTYAYYNPDVSRDYEYDTDEFNLRDYISFPNISATDASKYWVRLSINPKNTDYYTAADTTWRMIGNPAAPLARPTLTYNNNGVDYNIISNNLTKQEYKDGKREYQVAQVNQIMEGKYTIVWPTTNFDLNKVKVDVELVYAPEVTNHTVLFNTENYPKLETTLTFIEFKTDKVVKSATAPTTGIEVLWNEHEDMTAHVATAITVKDLFDNVINTQYPKARVDSLFADYQFMLAETIAQADPNATNETLKPIYKWVNSTDMYEAYGLSAKVVCQEVDDDNDSTTPAKKYLITNDKGLTVPEFDESNPTYNITTAYFKFDSVSGKFEFVGNTEPTSAITFTVHVAISYMNDAGVPTVVPVKIVVKPNPAN